MVLHDAHWIVILKHFSRGLRSVFALFVFKIAPTFLHLFYDLLNVHVRPLIINLFGLLLQRRYLRVLLLGLCPVSSAFGCLLLGRSLFTGFLKQAVCLDVVEHGAQVLLVAAVVVTDITADAMVRLIDAHSLHYDFAAIDVRPL